METKTIDNNQLWDFINTYFHDHPQHLVQHHIDSYNYFFETDLFRIFKENNPQTLHSEQYDETHQDYSHSLKMYFGGKNGDKIYFGKPVISDKGNPHIMMPNEARLRDINYSMPIHYDIEIEYTRYVTPEEAQQIEQRQKVIGGGQESSDAHHHHTPLPIETNQQIGGDQQLSQEQRDALKEKLLHNIQFQSNIHEYLLQGGSFQRDKVDEKDFYRGAGNKQKQQAQQKQTQPQVQTQSRTVVHISTFRLEQIYLGSFPIMVQSKFCILNGMSKEMRFSMGECLSDVGGYFIISGKEKAIIPQEKFGNNMLRVQIPTDEKYDWSADILSVSENISKPIRGLSIRKHAQTGQIVVLLPNVRSPVPLFIVFRALGVISDRDIIEMCLLDMEQYKGFVQDFRPSIHDAGSIFTQRDALEYIALLTKWKQLHTAQLILADYFLPHIGETNYLQKAYYLGYMVLKLLRAKNGLDQPTDRDHFKYKRLELVGTLISDLFREYYTIQLHKIHTAFESQMYFKRGQYAAHLDNLIADTHKPIFQNIRDVQQGFKKAFKGNWGGQPHTKRIGVVQDLNRLSSNSALDHLRKTNLPIDPSMVKVVALRVLHASQWGLFDPIDTPDGGNIGLHKHLSIMTHVTRQVSREPMIHWMRQKLSQFYLLADLRPTVAAKMSKVFVNGYWLGATTDPIQNMKKMLLHRRNGLLPIYTSISFDYRENILYIHTEGGRVCRPIFYWDDDSKAFSSSNIPGLFEKQSSTSSSPPSTETETKTQITWEKIVSGFNEKKLTNFDTEEGKIYELGELYQLTAEESKQKTPKRFIKHKAILEYMDNMESQYSLISLDPPYSSGSSTISPHAHPDRDTDDHPHRDNLDKETTKQTPKWTHQEIHPALNHGMMCNLIIFLENNPASRNNFSCTQSKQAVSLYHTNYQTRMDKTAVILNSGQIPLMKTRFLEYINGENNPYGTNAIVAIMCHTGYNVEDATLVNEGALQRGIFKTTYHSTYSAHEENNQTKASHFITTFVQSANVKNLVGTKPGCDYSHLDEYGIIKEGTEVDDKTVIIGMITKDLTPGSTDTDSHDCSVFPKKGQLGIVDKVFITEGEEGQRIAKVRIRETRIPAMGDKLASRAGQKGTIGMIVPECNMPFTAQGIRPDIIINPHAIPTRMTIGHLVECISGKACAQMGGYGDCTAYNNDGSKIQVFGEILASFGYHSSGNEVLYDGMTGQQMEASIFMGPNYYMRLKQMVKDKINYRSLGPNTALTRQPVSGRANDGGLRVGEMEKDAIYAHGISFFLQESLLDRGDHIYLAICNQTGMTAIYNPERNLIFSPMADGPVKYSGSLETGDMRLDVVSKFGRSFSVVKIPYVMKLFMQEMLACGIQMRLITEDNIQQLESMSFSHNLSLMMDETGSENAFAKVKRIVSKHVGDKRYEQAMNEDNRTPPQITAKNMPETTSETLSYAPGSPAYAPPSGTPDFSPPYAPGSTGYAPPVSLESPPYAPTSPGYVPSLDSNPNSSPGYNPYDYGTPSFDLSEPQIPQANPPQNPQQQPEQQLQVGGRMHFRGDSKPSRIWTVKNIGNQFLTIDTDDMEFISKADIPKIVTRGDLYPPSYLYQPQYQTGGFIQAQPFPSPTTLMPTPYQTPNAGSGTVINIGGAKLVSGDDNSTSKTVKENASDAFGGQNDKIETKIEGGKMEAKSALDFNQNLVIRKIE